MAKQTDIEAKVDALEEIVAELSVPKNTVNSVTDSTTSPLPLPTFKLGGKTYRFKIPGFNLGEGRVVIASEAISNPALLKEISESFPSLIEEV